MLKSQIENATRAGLPVDFEDVCRVSRDKRVATLRHVWPENCDARVWSGVHRAYALGAQALANRTGRAVEVYSAHGFQIAHYSPEMAP